MTPVPQPLPELFVSRLRSVLPPDQQGSCLQALAGPRTTAFRVNSLKGDPEATVAQLRRAGFALQPVGWRHDMYLVPEEQRRDLTECSAWGEGRIYLQNPASVLPPVLLDPQPGEEILDLAAAPGGKTIQLAEMMQNQGRIAAVDVARPRFFRLQRNLELCGVTCADTYLRDGAGVWHQCPERFDRVLLDAPCSAEGRIRTEDPASFAAWSEKKIRQISRRQRRLLFSAVQSLKPGGRIVYATCTFAPEENELVVEKSLKRFGNALEVEGVELPVANQAAGLTRWRDKSLHTDLARCARVIPDGVMAGFFMARLRKVRSTLGES